MPKRSWVEANSASPDSVSTGTPNIRNSPPAARAFTQDATQKSPIYSTSPANSPRKDPKPGSKMRRAHQTVAINDSVSANQQRMPSISRKVKACAACRKQKVRIFDTPLAIKSSRINFAR